MKELVKHLWACNREQIVARSLLHCHAHNLHSIMLLEAPGKTIRLFVAAPGHNLWGNCPQLFINHQTIAFHSHHCEITLLPICGDVYNWTVHEMNGGLLIKEYLYQSAITKGGIGFEFSSFKKISMGHIARLERHVGQYMPAEQMHTVMVEKDESAAWFVLEGRESAAPSKTCLSMTDLTSQDFSGLYKPAPEALIKTLLQQCNLIPKP